MTQPENPEAVAHKKAVQAAVTGPLLDRIVAVILRFVVLSWEQATVIALWVLHTYAIKAADTTPYLGVSSAEKRSGKTRLFEVLVELVARAMVTANISDAALFRSVGEETAPHTLFFDETDAIFSAGAGGGKEEQRGLINAGYRRGSHAVRCVGEGSKQTVVKFPVFGPKALAGIGKLPETIADRSLPIRLRRKLPTEKVERARIKNVKAAAKGIPEEAEAWADDATIEALEGAEPAIPEELDDRAADGAEPLLAIADHAGGIWPEKARKALLAVYGDKMEDGESWGVRLLASIRTAFGADKKRLFTRDLIKKLNEDEEQPWATWGRKDAGITARGLAGLLEKYEIKSGSKRIGDETAKGYDREQFEEVWSRYLRPEKGSDYDPRTRQPPLSGGLSVTPVTTAPQSHKPGVVYPSQTPSCDGKGPSANPHSNADVTDVTHGNGNERPATEEEEELFDRLGKEFGEG